MKYKTFKDKVFAYSAKKGVQAELFYMAGDSFKASVYEGEIDSYNLSNTMGVGIRVFSKAGVGNAYSEVLDERSVTKLVDSALDNALITGDQDNERPYYNKSDVYKTTKTYDDSVKSVSIKKKIDMAKELEKAVLTNKDIVRVQNCAIQTGVYNTHLSNTLGLDLDDQKSSAIMYVSPIAKKGDWINNGFAYDAGIGMDSLDIERIKQKGITEALKYYGAKQINSGAYNVVFDKETMATMLTCFFSIFSADSAQKGISLLKGREGEIISSQLLTIIDDPYIAGAFGSENFDGEGVPTYKKKIIEKGTLKTLLHNTKTASKAKISSTGNAGRSGIVPYIGITAHNCYIEKGTLALDDLLQDVGDGVYITDLMGMHAGANAASGDFSLLARGFVIAKGKLTSPIEQITVSGNFYSMIKSIKNMSDEVKFFLPADNGVFGAPDVHVGILNIAGK